MLIGGSSQLLNVRMVARLVSNFVLFLLCKYVATNKIAQVMLCCCCNTIVLSTVLQMAGLGFTVGTLAVFLKNQVLYTFSINLLYSSLLACHTLRTFPYIFLQFYITPDKVGLVFLSSSVFYVISAPIAGKIADKIVSGLHVSTRGCVYAN